MNQNEWDKTLGITCPNCGKEALRMIAGICLQCYRDKVAEREKIKEDKAERRYYTEQLRKGTISLAQMREGRL